MNKSTFLTLMFLSVATGCQTTNLVGHLPWKKSEEVKTEEVAVSRDGVPVSMVCVWKDATLDGVGKRTRGLAGRVYFHDAEKKPVKVAGNFTVYAYSSDGILGPSRAEPDRKYVFKAETMAEHHSVSDLGDSYSFWLPWDAVGGEETTLTLLPILRTDERGIIRGEEAVAILPGKKRSQIDSSIQELREELNGSKNQQVIYQSEDFRAHQERQKLMRTDTISVPRHADAVQLAMQQGTRPSMESANRISSTLQGDKTQVKTAEALDNATNESTSADSGMISRSSEEAWGRAMQEFQRRGPAMNHRLMPQSLQSNY